MQTNTIVKIILFASFILIWLILLINDIRNRSDIIYELNDNKIIFFLKKLRQKWYDLFFLVGISGIINALSSNTLYSLFIVLGFFIIFRIIVSLIRL